MSAPAQYLVTRYPGADVAGLGFVKASQSFFAPTPDYVPSRYFRAMNAAAVEGLRKLKADLEKFDAERAASLKDRKDPDGRPIRVPILAADVNLEPYVPLKEEPAVQDTGLSGDALAKLGEKDGRSFATETKGVKKRTADG